VLGLSLAAAGLYIGALVVGLLPVPRPVARLL
jgi:hypothetical protein